jgi:hypothetical protein
MCNNKYKPKDSDKDLIDMAEKNLMNIDEKELDELGDLLDKTAE